MRCVKKGDWKLIKYDVMDGKVRVHIHCYRHDDIEGIFRVMDDFEIQVASIQHALEAYKVRDLLAAHGTGIATWADWWGFKMEALDAIEENAALVDAQQGSCAVIHSDDAELTQRLNQEAAAALSAAHPAAWVAPTRLAAA